MSGASLAERACHRGYSIYQDVGKVLTASSEAVLLICDAVVFLRTDG